MTVRVRFAPSPTGHLHIGSVRTALFNYLFARRHGGQFILRIEDTDLNRNVEGAELQFLDGFQWLGITWDEGPDVGGPHAPYRCTDRLALYRKYLDQLMQAGQAYPCFCTDEELAAEREQAEQEGRVPRYSGKCRHLSESECKARIDANEPYSIRFAVPATQEIHIEDVIRGQVSFQTDDIGDFVIVKSNGIPTYNFQVVVDDAAMDITHVIRGEEHLSNTPRQFLLYQALGFDLPAFAHLPQVLDQSRKKLSKRDPNVLPIQQYRALGFVPQAMINFLALLGWSPAGEEELFAMDELIAQFDLARVSKSGAVFDVDKLSWMANQYFKSLPLETATSLVQQQVDNANWQQPAGVPDRWLGEVVSLYQEQMVCASDFLRLAPDFFKAEISYEADAKELLATAEARVVVEAYLAAAKKDEAWTADASKARFKEIGKAQGVKGKGLFMPVRAAVTGQLHGRDLQMTIALLPRQWVISRLETALTQPS
jgi:nondiscriminating glutamyl-tRNA synthetase